MSDLFTRTIVIEQDISLDDDDYGPTRGSIVETLTLRLPAGKQITVKFARIREDDDDDEPTLMRMKVWFSDGTEIEQEGCFTCVKDGDGTILWTPDSSVYTLWIWAAFK